MRRGKGTGAAARAPPERWAGAQTAYLMWPEGKRALVTGKFWLSSATGMIDIHIPSIESMVQLIRSCPWSEPHARVHLRLSAE